MKRGGQLIYAGPLGSKSRNLVQFFEVCSAVCVSSLKKLRQDLCTYTLKFTNRQFQECLKSGMAIILLHGCWMSRVPIWSKFLEWILPNTIDSRNYFCKSTHVPSNLTVCFVAIFLSLIPVCVIAFQADQRNCRGPEQTEQ